MATLKPEDATMMLELINKEIGTTQPVIIYEMSSHAKQILGQENACVFRGNIMLVNSEYLRSLSPDERKFIIAHELAHIEQYHLVKQDIVSSLCSWSSVIISILIIDNIDKLNKHYLNKWTAMLATLPVLATANTLLIQAYRRHTEYEADTEAAKKLGATAGAISFLNKHTDKHAQICNSWLKQLCSTHPAPKDRIKNINNTKI